MAHHLTKVWKTVPDLMHLKLDESGAKELGYRAPRIIGLTRPTTRGCTWTHSEACSKPSIDHTRNVPDPQFGLENRGQRYGQDQGGNPHQLW